VRAVGLPLRQSTAATRSALDFLTSHIAPVQRSPLSALCLGCISDQDTQVSKTLETFHNNSMNKKFPFYQLLSLLRPMVLVMEHS